MPFDNEPLTPPEVDTYWAALPDPEDLIHACNERIRLYAETLRSNLFWERVLRNWRYYHGLYYGDTGGSNIELKRLGEQGKYVGAAFNHFRSFARHLISLATEDKETFDTKAVNTEQVSLEQARLGNRILEFYVERDRIDRYMIRALEHALILQEGFVLTKWNERKGEKITAEADDEGNFARYIYAGDCELSNPTAFDVIRDLNSRTWRENQWVIIREYENRWDLSARYPEWERELLVDHDENLETPWLYYRTGVPYEMSDKISVFTLYHEPCDALPDGKMFRFLADDVYFDDPETPLPYKRGIQLRRVVDGEYVLTALGYSTMNDLQGPQEAFNGETSSICTNHKSFGVQNIWVQEGDRVRAEQLEGKLQVIRSRMKPEGLNITLTPAEIYKFRDAILRDMEQISGVNSVARGTPEANLRSGTALALIDAKMVRYAAPLIRSYKQLWADVGTDILHTLNEFSPEGHPRVVSVTGIHEHTSQYIFQRGSLDNVDRVIVRTGNPLAKTTSGRLELANLYIKSGMVRMPEHLISVLETGQIESLIEAERSQIQVVRDENEKMMEGQPVVMYETDYHVLHIREHQAVLNSTDVRFNSEAAQMVQAHIMEHLMALMQPGVQMLQHMLGFTTGAIGMQQPMAGGPNGNMPETPPMGQDSEPQPAREPAVPQAANY